MAENKWTLGDLYIYTGETEVIDGKETANAIAVAANGKGPNGGWIGISVAKMAIPSKNLSQEKINSYADLFRAAPELAEGHEQDLHTLADIGQAIAENRLEDAIKIITGMAHNKHSLLAKARGETS